MRKRKRLASGERKGASTAVRFVSVMEKYTLAFSTLVKTASDMTKSARLAIGNMHAS